MKSLTDLNTFSNTQVTVVDNRATNIVIGQVTDTPINIIESTRVFPAINAYEIYSITNAAETNVRLQLNLGSSQASVQWSNDTRFTIVQTGTTYTVVGINSAADWDLIKNPIISISEEFTGATFTYSFSITYNTATQTNLVVNWTVNKSLVFSSFNSTTTLLVNPNKINSISAALLMPFDISTNTRTIILSEPALSVLYSSLTQNINTPTLFESSDTLGATWTVVMQAPPESISNIVATGYSAYTNYDSATGIFTITGNITNVNEAFNAIRVTTTSLQSNFDILYIASNNITTDVDSVTQVIVNGNLLKIELNNVASLTATSSDIRFSYTAELIQVLTSTDATITDTDSFPERQPKFNKYLRLVNSGYAKIPDPKSKFDFGTGNFTVEGWYRFNSTLSTDRLLFGGEKLTGSFDFRRYNDNTLRIGRTNVSWDVTTVPFTFLANTYYHLAVSRNNGFMRIFINGVQRWSGDNTINYSMSPNAYIGYRPGGGEPLDVGNFNGAIDEVRISNIARYTGDFSVQTAPFVNDSNTIMLLHFDTETNNFSPDDIS